MEVVRNLIWKRFSCLSLSLSLSLALPIVVIIALDLARTIYRKFNLIHHIVIPLPAFWRFLSMADGHGRWSIKRKGPYTQNPRPGQKSFGARARTPYSRIVTALLGGDRWSAGRCATWFVWGFPTHTRPSNPIPRLDLAGLV
uniref:Putative secreted protein n=1 Tax=Anopheles darlingi TaxID=43151 RepID=A0A2M4D7L8_ANODA